MAVNISAVDAAVLAVVGEELIYTRFGGVATPITALYQEPDISVETVTVQFTTNGPIAFCHRADVPDPTKQDTILRTLTGKLYEVKDFELDEGALTVLDLEETA